MFAACEAVVNVFSSLTIGAFTAARAHLVVIFGRLEVENKLGSESES